MFLRNFLVALAIVGLILTAAIYTRVHHKPDKKPPIVSPSFSPYENTVAASGIVEALSENIQIGAPSSGLVKSVDIKVSERVKKDAPLFTLDDRELKGKLLVQQATVETRKANLKKLKDQLARLQNVKDPRAVSQDDITTKTNDVNVAEAELKVAIAEVEETKLLLDRLTVRAPKDGVILKNDLRVGQFVQATREGGFLILGDLDQLQVRVDVDEQNATRIRPSLPAVAYPKNDTKHEIPLHFLRIEPFVIPKRSLTGNSDERVDTRVLQLIYTFEQNPDYPLFVGQQVDVYIDVTK